MKVLFISDDFFGYAKEIKKALELRGEEVLWFPDRHATDALSKAAIRLAPGVVRGKAEEFFQTILSSVAARDVDRVLVIKGEGLSVSMISRLRAALPKAEFTLYFWDSYKNMPSESPEKVARFDRVFTFDPVDAANDKRLAYRPLFYLDDYARLTAAGSPIDMLFFGTVHTDRYAVLSRLQRALPSSVKIEKILYFPSRWIYRMRRLFDPSFWGANEREFIFSPLPRAEVMALLARARIVIDIERPVQAGLTMRTLEMLGASKKLITTNREVLNADFYDASNILVIDRVNPVVPEQFLREAYKPLPNATIANYSLTGWLKEVLPQRLEVQSPAAARMQPAQEVKLV